MLKVKDGNGYYAYFEPANRREATWCIGRASGDEAMDSSCTGEKTVYKDLIRMFSVKNNKDKRKIKALIQKCEKKKNEFYKAEPGMEDDDLWDEAELFIEKAGVVAAESAGFKRFW